MSAASRSVFVLLFVCSFAAEHLPSYFVTKDGDGSALFGRRGALAGNDVVDVLKYERGEDVVSEKSCPCTEIESPVCGTNGETYQNACKADCENVQFECEGPCPCGTAHEPPCHCGDLNSPVCGEDGKDYRNVDCAECAGTTAKCGGKCPCEPGACPAVKCANTCHGARCPAHPYARCVVSACEGCRPEFSRANIIVDCGEGEKCDCDNNREPVCGKDGLTYSNACYADCENMKIDCKGECPCEKHRCGCHKDHEPVCGVDGRTYHNRCFAECNKKEIKCEGQCPCKPLCTAPTVQCLRDPCGAATCPDFPQARCVPNFCGGCNADFYVDGTLVSCDSTCRIEGEECRYADFIERPFGNCCTGLSCCECTPSNKQIWSTTKGPTCQKKCSTC